MSGLYLPDMEMPKSCLACEWCVHTIPADNYICYRLNRAVIGVAEEDVNETVNVCCPLIPVPDHGRLVDADALIAWFEEWYDPNADLEICHCIDILDDNSVTPTIIPADKEGEG